MQVCAFEELTIRSYDEQKDKARVDAFERNCDVGPPHRSVFLFTDSMGDPISRIRHSPLYNMLVAEIRGEVVGVVRGTIKVARVLSSPAGPSKVGYVLGLRVSPLHRQKGIGGNLVRRLEEWFAANWVDYVYMATEKDNEASVRLFVDRLGYVKFRTPAILVNPVRRSRPYGGGGGAVRVYRLSVEAAESLYRGVMGAAEFFPEDIGDVLRNKLSLGTWVAEAVGSGHHPGLEPGSGPRSWAMVSVWNSGEVFKLRLGKAPLSWRACARGCRWVDRVLPCLKVPLIPDLFRAFGFYFLYGVHREGPDSGRLVRTLFEFVHDMAAKSGPRDCRVVVTEVGGWDSALKLWVPHSKVMSCAEDLWCVKALNWGGLAGVLMQELVSGRTPSRALFVDPREV
ncbi:probable N-acetyltransferase HLS1-like [Malania oleifera]|uniref:probable N-acetyltransferase HLS1-like n=1 Tax=Malania oleifera TaxID=397392 RepID=UPI0025ADCAF6|nr:probable N-acetyltransferase HLS1-like [Malania oleifera]